MKVFYTKSHLSTNLQKFSPSKDSCYTIRYMLDQLVQNKTLRSITEIKHVRQQRWTEEIKDLYHTNLMCLTGFTEGGQLKPEERECEA